MTDPPDSSWPDWLADIYGPAPIGPQRRAEAFRKAEERNREIEARLREMIPPIQRPPGARQKQDITAEDLRQARIALGLEPPDEPDERRAEAAE